MVCGGGCGVWWLHSGCCCSIGVYCDGMCKKERWSVVEW